uniref:Uncharacterized protein n=1 Tax=Panagrolaimus sp. PS1159 TaxID=55785 RepID=A0AC35GEC4_9BILA
MISNSFIIKMQNSPYTVKTHKRHVPSAPSEGLMTPVSTKRLYPKLFSTPKTPQSVLIDHIAPHINASCSNNNNTSTQPTTFNPKYWTVFLKPNTFDHYSIVERRVPNPIVDFEKPKSTFPTLKKLKKCGNYMLSWEKCDNLKKIEYQIKGHVFPTVGHGIAVVFETKEKISHEIDEF